MKKDKNSKPKTKPERKHLKEGRPLRIVLFVILGILVAALIAVGIYFFNILNKASNLEASDPNDITQIEQEDENETADPSIPTINPDTLVTPQPTVEPKTNEEYGIINIMVFGVDNRSRNSFSGRSDVNILLTLDTKNNEVRMTSIMRDTLIYIPAKEDFNRINAAIVYENGPEGAVVAIEQEFGIDIDHFIVSSFHGVQQIIDALGGITMTVSMSEVWQMNGLIQEMNLLWGHRRDDYLMYRSGEQVINGIQTVAYARIRKDDGVFKRNERQLEVLAAAREKLSGITLGELDTLLNTVTEWVKTDMEPLELISVANELYKLRTAGYKTIRVPFDDHYETARYNGMAIIQYDKEYTIDKMHDFVYRGIEP